MVLKIDGERCKKAIDPLMEKLRKKNIYKCIRLWFKKKISFIVWALVMVGLLGLTVVGFTLLTTICNNIV